MHIEMIEFYPYEIVAERGIVKGTLRIKLPEQGIHILGVLVSKRKGRWYFQLPGKQSVHHETGANIRYPFITFEDPNRQKSLIDAIRKTAPAFIEHCLLKIEQPVKPEHCMA
jgi:hypothetical protein